MAQPLQNVDARAVLQNDLEGQIDVAQPAGPAAAPAANHQDGIAPVDAVCSCTFLGLFYLALSSIGSVDKRSALKIIWKALLSENESQIKMI